VTPVIGQALGDPGPVQVFQQRDRYPPGGAERLPGLGGGERLRQPGQDPRRLGLRVRGQHDLLGHPQQQAGPRRSGNRPRVETQFTEPARVRSQERRVRQVGQDGLYRGGKPRRQ
jgi:hypothetical protein